MEPTTPKILLTAKEFKAATGLGINTVYELINTNQVPWVGVGTARRIPYSAAVAYFDALAAEHKTLEVHQ